MTFRFRELDNQQTPLGELSLRVRLSAAVPDTYVYEVTLNGEFLMSSVVNDSERALATLALDLAGDGAHDVLVGGLGLGYTALAALAYDTVRSLRVIESLAPVIQWHRDGLVPAAQQLADDARCEVVHADFFDHLREDLPRWHSGRYDVILLDIDHSPDALLHDQHAEFYTEAGLRLMTRHLRPAGIFALWAAEPPSDDFLDLLRQVFDEIQIHPVSFFNPFHNRRDENTLVLARLAHTVRSFRST